MANSKKRLGFDPLDDIDILKGPIEPASDKAPGDDCTGKIASDNTGKIAGKKTGVIAGNISGDIAGNNASFITGNIDGNNTGDIAGDFTIPKKNPLRKMTYYFRNDQLQEMDKLSNKSGYDKSELARMAFDLFLKKVRIK